MERQSCGSSTQDINALPMAENLFCTMPPARDVEAHGGPGNLSGHPRAGSLLRHPKFDLRAQLEPFARDLGFGLFAFLALQGYGADPTDYSLQCYVSNYPEPWKARYEHEGLHHQDPIVAIGGLKREIFAWYARDPDLCLTDMHQRLVEMMCAYRLFCGSLSAILWDHRPCSWTPRRGGDRIARDRPL
jgi:hypothetical protein